MLTKKQKEALIEELSKEIAASKTVVVCDYKGLTVADLQEVRRSLRSNQASMRVVKKTFANLAFTKAGTELDVRKFPGQAALAMGGSDEISVPKVIADFSKKNDKMKILAGILESKALSGAEVINLAKLPNRQQLLGTLVGTIKAPVSGFVNVLSGNLRNLVGVLSAIKEAK